MTAYSISIRALRVIHLVTQPDNFGLFLWRANSTSNVHYCRPPNFLTAHSNIIRKENSFLEVSQIMKTKINALLIAWITAFLTGCATSPEAQMLNEMKALTKGFEMAITIAEEDDIDVHIENLNKRDRAYRCMTVAHLGSIGPDAKKAIGPLTKIAKQDREPKIRITAIEALESIGGRSINPTLREISLNDKNPEVRLTAKSILER